MLFHFFIFFQKIVKNLKLWGREQPIFEKLRFWAVWCTYSDRPRCEDSDASNLASRGPLHPIIEAFLFFDCFLIFGITFLASYEITKAGVAQKQ